MKRCGRHLPAIERGAEDAEKPGAVAAQVDHSLAATASGAQVGLAMDASRALFFDASGLRIA